MTNKIIATVETGINATATKSNDPTPIKGNLSVTTEPLMSEETEIETEVGDYEGENDLSISLANNLTGVPWSDLNIGDSGRNVGKEILVERNVALLERSLARAVAGDIIASGASESDGRDGCSNNKTGFTPYPVDGEAAIPTLEPKVRWQLRKYVYSVAETYRGVHFHSFEHASHVTLNAAKLVELIGDKYTEDQTCRSPPGVIEPDPWRWRYVAIIFAGLIHDIDHKGVSNKQLKEEGDELSIKYGDDGSLAERNSVEIAINLLQEPQYDDFRAVLFGDTTTTNGDRNSELHFIDLINAVVLCTDIACPKRRQICKEKWDAAFGSNSNPSQTARNDAIMEQLLQLADVGHTAQAWPIFIKWNRQLYDELEEAFQAERGPDPKTNWYEGQIGFFDHYILPLAERVANCGMLRDDDGRRLVEVARENRDRWSIEGQEVTQAMLSRGYVDSDDGEASEEGSFASFGSDIPVGGKKPLCSIPLSLSVSLNKNPEGIDDRQVRRGSLSSQESHNTFPQQNLSLRNASQHSQVNQALIGSVDGVTPEILVKQILASITGQLIANERGRTEVDFDNRVEAMQKATVDYKKNGSIHRYNGTLLFVDISGFTFLSQHYPIEDFKRFINEYFTNIIGLVVSYGGEVVKFAGDALYALWSDDTGFTLTETDNDVLTYDQVENQKESHGLNIAKCIACGMAITSECNNYKVSKTYSKRKSTQVSSSSQRGDLASRRANLELERDGAGEADYEERAAYLNVHCGIGEGSMAGVDIVAETRAEFFLIGQPVTDVAMAENLAKAGELVISPSVYTCVGRLLDNPSIMNSALHHSKAAQVAKILSPFEFNMLVNSRGFYKVQNKNTDQMTSTHPSNIIENRSFIKPAQKWVQEVVSRTLTSLQFEKDIGDSFHSINDNDSDFLAEGLVGEDNFGESYEFFEMQESILEVLGYHSHESTRGAMGQMSAELRSVVVLFIKVLYEPKLDEKKSQLDDSTSTRATSNSLDELLREEQLESRYHTEESSSDEDILKKFQSIFNIIFKCLSFRKGQIRQFISDDKGTVCIASFGLRGSATLNVAATAVDAAQDIQKRLLRDVNTNCTIGITLGKAFCGETGSPSRYEYSIMGSSVNLSARYMAYGAVGTINCDESIKLNDSTHMFRCDSKHLLKGFAEPVPFFNPVDPDSIDASSSEKANDVDSNRKMDISVRREEIAALVKYMIQQQQAFENAESCQDSNAKMEEQDEIAQGQAQGQQEDIPATELDLLPTAILVDGPTGVGKTQFIAGVLADPSIQSGMTILEANKCYHNSPFYCWIPIITKIIKGSGRVKKRLRKLKKLHRKVNLPPSLYASGSHDNEEGHGCDDLVPDKLLPFLGVINDFLYQGFPLFRRTEQVKSLKEKQKTEKVVEVLSAMVVRYLNRKKKCGIIAFHDIDAVDSYSRQLIQHLYNSNCKLIFISSIKQNDKPPTEHPIFVCPDREIKAVRLEHLSKYAVFEVFRQSVTNISDTDRELLDHPEIVEKVYEICGGIPKYAVEFAHAFSVQLKHQLDGQQKGCRDYLVDLLRNFPSKKMDELIYFRFDNLSPEGQMLLKVASVAGTDQYSFSLNLIETLLLRLNNGGVTLDFSMGSGIDEDLALVDGKNDIAIDVGQNSPIIDNLFQEDNLETTMDSLVDQNFLIEINADMGDYFSDEGVQSYRFVNSYERTTINELMLDDQKLQLHLNLAEYYEIRVSGASDDDDEYLDDDDADDVTESTFSSSFTSDNTLIQSWQLLHLTAIHYDLAGLPIKALRYFFDSAIELGRLGVRDKSHGCLLSAYLMFEKRLHESSAVDTSKFDDDVHERNRLAKHTIRMICDQDVPSSMQDLTQEHLKWMFEGDIDSFIINIQMLIKFGQSIGIIEEEGYKLGFKIYLQVIFLTLLTLNQMSFNRTMLRVENDSGGVLDPSSVVGGQDDKSGKEMFCLDKLTVSFPAFSGMLTFYRDSPIQNEANLKRETVLAQLFVAITEEMNEMVHILRTRCILSHLYLKTGEVEKALDVCESIKDSYDHDEHSLNLVQLYGMDWALINVNAMTSEYILRGDIVAALNSLKFLEETLEMLDEFASSTKPMLKGTLSSLYLILQNFDKALVLADGITATSFGFFYKKSGILQEGLTKKLKLLRNKSSEINPASNSDAGTTSNESMVIGEEETCDPFQDDLGVLSILTTEKMHKICPKRTMLHASIEVLSDRGLEALEADICTAEIEWLEKKYVDTLQNSKGQDGEIQQEVNGILAKQLEYCQAGLAHLEQSLGQEKASSHEKRTNYVSCLYQKAELLVWRSKLEIRLDETPEGCEAKSHIPTCKFNKPPMETLKIEDETATSSDERVFDDRNVAKRVLLECEQIVEKYNYPIMLMMVGARYVKLDLDPKHGEELISRALQYIETHRSPEDCFHARQMLQCLQQ